MKRTKSLEHKAEMAARRERREARSRRQVQRRVNAIALREYINRITHDRKMVSE